MVETIEAHLRMARKQCDPPAEHAATRHHAPAWAKGLRKLYDDVLAEPLPECFADILAKLDKDES